MHGALFAPSVKPAKDNSSGERTDGEGGALFCKEIFPRRRAKCGCFSYREPLRLNLAQLSDLATSSSSPAVGGLISVADPGSKTEYGAK